MILFVFFYCLILKQNMKKAKKLLYFYSNGCKPCTMLSPHIQNISKNPKYIELNVEKINVKENPDLVKKYNIKQWPKLFLLDSNNKILNNPDEKIPLTKVRLERKIEPFLFKIQ